MKFIELKKSGIINPNLEIKIKKINQTDILFNGSMYACKTYGYQEIDSIVPNGNTLVIWLK